MLIVVLALYFVIIILFTLIKSPKIESRTLNLFKSMFPSWKFFDESLDTPVLLYRTKKSDLFGPWQILLPPPNFQWFNVFFNPKGNFYLACHSHIQQLLGDLTNTDETQIPLFHHQISYKITENLVRFELQKQNIESEFQFKLSAIKLNKNAPFEVIEDILISPVLQLCSEDLR